MPLKPVPQPPPKYLVLVTVKYERLMHSREMRALQEKYATEGRYEEIVEHPVAWVTKMNKQSSRVKYTLKEWVEL